ncbi:hypothetical protein C8R43DRAFT_956815 [Mycena crocata]|nr:hypothetical protein C8R43DRAFT_956815 [Mycena crocata]
MARSYISDSRSHFETMLRELSGPPDLRQFLMSPCPNGYDHSFHKNTGDGVPMHIGLWELICHGTMDYSRSTSSAGNRCPTQRPDPLAIEEVKYLWALGDNYRGRQEAVSGLCNHVEKSNLLMASLWELPPSMPLPPQAAARICNDLREVEQGIETLAGAFMPPKPEILEDSAKGKAKYFAEWDSGSDDEDGFSDDSDKENVEIDVYVPQPLESSLPLLCPTSSSSHNNDPRSLRIVIFSQRFEHTYHARASIPEATKFRFTTLPLPHGLSNGKFLFYSVLTERYEDAAAPVNMVGRGKFMVYLIAGLNRLDCPGLRVFEKMARDSAEQEGKELDHYDAIVLPSSAPLSSSSSLPPRHRSRVQSPTRPAEKVAPKVSSKRTREPEEAVPSKKARVVLKVGTGTNSDPYTIPSSDFLLRRKQAAEEKRKAEQRLQTLTNVQWCAAALFASRKQGGTAALCTIGGRGYESGVNYGAWSTILNN